MTRLNPPVTQRGKEPTALDVSNPDKVVRLLSVGWSLADGEKFDAEKAKKKKPRELNAADLGNREVALGLTTTSDDTSATESSGGDTTLDDIPDDEGEGEEDEEEDSSAGVAKAASAGSLPGLSGKTRDALVAIAEAEGVKIESDANKPTIKRLIEAHRENQ